MSLTMQCVDCLRVTTVIEANLRKFNPARCACGGELVPRDPDDTILGPAHSKDGEQ